MRFVVEKIKQYQFFIFIALVLLVSTLVWWHYFGTHGKILGDAKQYQELSLNLLRNHSFSLDGELSMMREPAYPVFLAVNYYLFGVNPTIIRVEQVVLYYLIILMAYFLASKIFNIFIARFTALILSVYPVYIISTNLLYSEILATFFAMVLVLFFYLAQKTDKISFYAAAGLTLGLLILTKCAFIIFAPLCLLLILINRGITKNALKIALIFSACLILVTVPWVARNYSYFGEPSFASRGGVLLYQRAIRVDYDRSQVTKYLITSFGGEYFVRRFVDVEYDYERDGKGVYAGREERDRIYRMLGTENYDKVDGAMRKDAIKIVKEHPVSYFLWGLVELNNLNSPMIYYDRHFGIFHDDIYGHEILKSSTIILLRFGWYLFLALVVLGGYNIIKTKYRQAYILLLAVIAANSVSFFLDGVPRFLMPVFPIYIVLALCGLICFTNAHFYRNKAGNNLIASG